MTITTPAPAPPPRPRRRRGVRGRAGPVHGGLSRARTAGGGQHGGQGQQPLPEDGNSAGCSRRVGEPDGGQRLERRPAAAPAPTRRAAETDLPQRRPFKEWSRGCWNSRPTRAAMRPGGIPSMLCPWTRTSPASGRSSPLKWRSSVDFPLPFGPVTATFSPGRTVRSRFRSTPAGHSRSRSPAVQGPAPQPLPGQGQRLRGCGSHARHHNASVAQMGAPASSAGAPSASPCRRPARASARRRGQGIHRLASTARRRCRRQAARPPASGAGGRPPHQGRPAARPGTNTSGSAMTAQATQPAQLAPESSAGSAP